MLPASCFLLPAVIHILWMSFSWKNAAKVILLAFGFCFVLGLQSLIAADTPSSAITPEDSQELEILKAHWKSQREGVYTVKVKFQRFSSNEYLAPLSPDDLMDIFRPDVLAESPDSLQELIDKIENLPGKNRSRGSEIDFIMDGQKTREEGSTWTQVFDGEDIIIKDKLNSHIKIGEEGNVPMYRYTLEDLRFIPHDKIISRISAIEGSPDMRVYLREHNPTQHVQCWLEIDSSTQMVSKYVREFPDSNTLGAAYTVQGGWVTCQGDIHWPRVFGSFRFRGNPLQLVDIDVCVTKSVEVNGVVDNDTFLVGAESKDVAFDYRKSSPTSKVISAPTNDSKTTFAEITHEKFGQDFRRMRWWTIAGNLLAIIFVLLAVKLWRHNRQVP